NRNRSGLCCWSGRQDSNLRPPGPELVLGYQDGLVSSGIGSYALDKRKVSCPADTSYPVLQLDQAGRGQRHHPVHRHARTRGIDGGKEEVDHAVDAQRAARERAGSVVRREVQLGNEADLELSPARTDEHDRLSRPRTIADT